MRKFGIELELVAPRGLDPSRAAIATLTAAGVNTVAAAYTGRHYHVWQAKPDASLQPHGRCIEVVSRILPANESGYTEVATAVGALERAGFGINRTCGFHVHLNVADLTPEQRLLVALRYAHLQARVNLMLPPSRRANSYAASFSPSEITRMQTAIANGAAATLPVSHGDHFHAVNIEHIHSGTAARLEFRQAAGTCNPEKVLGWVRFLQDMVEEVANRSRGVRFSPAPTPMARDRMDPSWPAAHGAATRAPRPTTVTPARRPRLREGSHAQLVMLQLCQRGFASQAWATNTGILPHVFRSIITGFRRHGALIDTDSSAQGLTYRVAPVVWGLRASDGITEGMLFRGLPRAVTAAPTPVPVTESAYPPSHPARLDPPAGFTPASVVAYDFDAGLTEASRAWCAQRRAVFAEDTEEAGQVRAA